MWWVSHLLLFLGGVAAALVRLYRRDAAAATGVAAGLATWAFHAGLDWDWEMPAVTLPALLLAAAAVSWSEEDPPPRPAHAGASAQESLLGMTRDEGETMPKAGRSGARA